MQVKRSICLFAHYNPLLQVAQYVITYLQHLENVGFEIIFLSSSPIKEEDRQLLAKSIRNCRVFEKENSGRDLGAWKWAFENQVIPEDADRLLLTNDSVYGPFFPLEEVFTAMEAKAGIDFWGLTDNYQGGWHIQSYFLCFSKQVFRSEAFKKVFRQDFSTLSRLDIIKKGELLLSSTLTAAGFKSAVYVPYARVVPGFDEWDARNATHFFWDHLIERFRFPFVKKDLVLQNPENLQTIEGLFHLIEKHSRYPIDNIKQSIADFLTSSLPPAPLAIPEKISVICHLYYPGTIYYFLSRICVLRSPETQFFFNISSSLYHNGFFLEMLAKFFPGAVILYTPNQGRDIGGKIAAIDILLKSGILTDYSLIIHDKLSPHTATGIEWRDKLLTIIDPERSARVFKIFRQNSQVGVITARDLIKNEFDPDNDRFTCTSSDNIFSYIKDYKLKIGDYNFAAGTIFWIRTRILRDFFSVYPPLSVRKSFEKGNALDFDKGTNIHAWERLFSFIADSQGFKTTGI